MTEGHLGVSFKEYAALTDLQFVVEVSDDMQAWFSGPSYVEQLNRSANSLDLETRFFRAVRSSEVSPFQVMRVRIVYAP